ncbi:aldo/keto reductase [Pseudothauera nasutitermitis]|uniref:Aldo/keto reductase n=1 Tax=Pseudothauera nasutitermitis TaxID=2565930 RepID=A0A4S4AXW0_9RHOO|nr:aldo/keto reductase [Pseudothauera nasutitermitis]THF64780.1 aldo/keto reductase [Pseudothauera nasutitermitis]
MHRRTLLGAGGALAVTLAAGLPLPLWARERGASTLVTARIPGADQDVPVIGIGTARRYADPQSAADFDALRATIARFVELGGQVIDTAPSYGRAEAVVGQLVEELGVRDRLFLATKVGVSSRAEGLAEIERSFANLRTQRIDLIAVHNLRDVDNQLDILRDLKAAGRIRALGATTSFERQHADFEAMMRRQKLDVIQIDYALDNRKAAERILPLAREQGLAVMINLPFGRGRLFEATKGRPLPDWAAEFGAATWAQFFLKYIVSHPAGPIAIPGTAQVRYAEDNLGAARPPLPDEALRRRMEALVDAL